MGVIMLQNQDQLDAWLGDAETALELLGTNTQVPYVIEV